MKKPYQTGATSSQQPNEPKMYPGDQKFSGTPGGAGSLEGFAENAKIKAPDQLNHIAVPIDQNHILGKALQEPKQVHVTPKMMNANKMPSFADKEKIKIPRVRTGQKSPKI